MATTNRKAGAAAAVAAAAGAGWALIASLTLDDFEGNKLVPYRDTGGVWTACRGVTGPSVIPGRTYTLAECQALNEIALQAHCKPIHAMVHVPLAESQKAAWCSFGYNVGVGAFQKSTALRLINEGKPLEACAQISRYHYVAGKDCNLAASNCRGIVERRAFERALCEGKF